jgi:hypothetical protein
MFICRRKEFNVIYFLAKTLVPLSSQNGVKPKKRKEQNLEISKIGKNGSVSIGFRIGLHGNV